MQRPLGAVCQVCFEIQQGGPGVGEEREEGLGSKRKWGGA